MRFDDSLATVLAVDTTTRSGAEAAWRQLVDLAGRQRVADVDLAVERLRGLRDRVAPAVRGASGRALAMAAPPAALVAFFAEDELAIAAPVLRTASLGDTAWLALLPALTPAGRSVLRHRRDLSSTVTRALASFGATDFVLGHDSIEPAAPAPDVEPVVVAEPAAPLAESTPAAPRFEIADLVARLDAFRREQPKAPPPAIVVAVDRFQFHADAAGVIRWVEGVARGALVGVDLTRRTQQGLATPAGDPIDTAVAFRDARLQVGGDSSAAGIWSLAGEPRFDRATGRLTGIAGTGRRVPAPVAGSSRSDTLRQLVHELRTPANAIAGFAELIATELLGPVPPVYRDRAVLIGREASGLGGAIDDLDTAARLEGNALDVRSAPVDLRVVLDRAIADLEPVAQAGDVTVSVQGPASLELTTDDRVARRLIDRLLAAAIAVAAPGERLHVHLVAKAKGPRLHITRPAALGLEVQDALFQLDQDENEHLPLGTGFTLRLIRDLAAALGGALTVGADRLTLRLPAAVTPTMERATAQ